MNNDVKSFFANLHRNEKTMFRGMKTKGGKTTEIQDIKDYFNEEVQNQLNSLNEEDYEIYFLVNSGGYKADEITKFNAVFIDLDCGRDDDGNYFTKDTTTEYKYEQIIKLQQYELEPTYIIETRNGLHAYWFIEEGSTAEEFAECEKRLIQHFNADPVVKNPNRLLRVPGTKWCKDPRNKYPVRILEDNQTRYKIKDIINSLPKVSVFEAEGVCTIDKECTTLLPIYGTNPSLAQDHLQLIQQRDVAALHKIINPEPIRFSTHDEVYDYLKKQNMNLLLGLDGYNFSCIFHDDKTPSAGIIKNKKNGHFIYNCLSGSCNVSYNIIQVTEQLTSMNIRDTLNFLRKVYKVEYIDTEWKKEKKVNLDNNVEFISSTGIQEEYRELNDFVSRYSELLLFLHQFSRENIITENYTDKLGMPLFFISLSHLSKMLGKDLKTIANRINILTYLGLIRKIPNKEIPADLLKKSRGYAKLKQYNKLISYYSIPVYDKKNIQFASQKAKEYKQLGFTVRDFGREMVYRTLGEEEANRVFPQEQGKQLSETSNRNASKVEEILMSLITDKGWTTEKEVINTLDETYGRKAYNGKLVKRILPEALDKYGLKKQWLNKELKQNLQVTLEGYPKIIIQN
ncbi:DNA-primase RepB domain-containing protein [Rossellomorea vietnamensis]|uniref:DNA-primase RepB domain-containing protein n=1 Tax=Rossellomorea vietnamensis TaxID=218284 RepID=UPI003CE74255